MDKNEHDRVEECNPSLQATVGHLIAENSVTIASILALSHLISDLLLQTNPKEAVPRPPEEIIHSNSFTQNKACIYYNDHGSHFNQILSSR